MTDARPLTPEDLRILGLETDTIAGHVAKVVVVDALPSGRRPLEELTERVETRVAQVPPLRQRLSSDGTRWEDDPAFAVERHVVAAPAGPTPDPEQLLGVVASLMGGRLDRDRPLWSIHVVDELADGGWAMVWRIHHAMADGMTAMRWASDLLWDEGPDVLAAVPAPAGRDGARTRWLARGDAVRRAPATLARELRPVRGRSPFAGPLTAERAVGLAQCPLDDLRRIERAAGDGTTVNDVLLAAVAGGLRRWLLDTGRPLFDARVKVPVSMHPKGTADDLGNRDSFLFVDLPLREPDAMGRLRSVHRETRDRKNRRDAPELYALMEALGRVRPLGKAGVRLTMSPHVFTLNVSNVPGPRDERHIGGARVRSVYDLAEVAPQHGLRVAATSFAGTLFIGLVADPHVVPDISHVASAVEDEVVELLRVVG